MISFNCNGYPIAHNLTPREQLYKFDTSRVGLSNLGHDEMILIKDGKEKFSAQDKKDIIQFLQTL